MVRVVDQRRQRTGFYTGMGHKLMDSNSQQNSFFPICLHLVLFYFKSLFIARWGGGGGELGPDYTALIFRFSLRFFFVYRDWKTQCIAIALGPLHERWSERNELSNSKKRQTLREKNRRTRREKRQTRRERMQFRRKKNDKTKTRSETTKTRSEKKKLKRKKKRKTKNDGTPPCNLGVPWPPKLLNRFSSNQTPFDDTR